jgi:PA14 domain
MKWILLFPLVFSLFSCGKGDGFAPSSEGLVNLSIQPTSLIVPKSISTNIQVINNDSLFGTKDVTAKAVCTTNNPIATVSGAGQVANTYTGTAIQLVQLTCTYGGKTVSIPMTIVPATLQSLTLTKNSLSMAPGQSQTIQVYGNFIDSLSYVFALDMTNYVSWASTLPAVSSATTGNVAGGTAGTAVITASFSSKSVSTDVTVAAAAPTASIPRGVGLTGTYYDFVGPINASGTFTDPFATLFGSRIDSQVYFNWSTGTNNLGQPLYFGIRWTGKVYVPTTGSYTFYTTSDDGVRLWINDVNGTAIIDNWTLHASVENPSAPMVLMGGQFYDIKMEYFENAGYSQAELRWSGPSIAKQLIPQINLFPQ